MADSKAESKVGPPASAAAAAPLASDTGGEAEAAETAVKVK